MNVDGNDGRPLIDWTVDELRTYLREKSQTTVFSYNDVLGELLRKLNEERELRAMEHELKREAYEQKQRKVQEQKEAHREAKNDLYVERQHQFTVSNYILSTIVAIATVIQAVVAFLTYLRPGS